MKMDKILLWIAAMTFSFLPIGANASFQDLLNELLTEAEAESVESVAVEPGRGEENEKISMDEYYFFVMIMENKILLEPSEEDLLSNADPEDDSLAGVSQIATDPDDQSNDAQSNDAQSNDAQSNDAQSNDAQSNDAQSNDAQSNDAQSNDGQIQNKALWDSSEEDHNSNADLDDASQNEISQSAASQDGQNNDDPIQNEDKFGADAANIMANEKIYNAFRTELLKLAENKSGIHSIGESLMDAFAKGRGIESAKQKEKKFLRDLYCQIFQFKKRFFGSNENYFEKPQRKRNNIFESTRKSNAASEDIADPVQWNILIKDISDTTLIKWDDFIDSNNYLKCEQKQSNSIKEKIFTNLNNLRGNNPPNYNRFLVDLGKYFNAYKEYEYTVSKRNDEALSSSLKNNLISINEKYNEITIELKVGEKGEKFKNAANALRAHIKLDNQE
jgi:hypothetical protein